MQVYSRPGLYGRLRPVQCTTVTIIRHDQAVPCNCSCILCMCCHTALTVVRTIVRACSCGVCMRSVTSCLSVCGGVYFLYLLANAKFCTDANLTLLQVRPVVDFFHFKSHRGGLLPHQDQSKRTPGAERCSQPVSV
jgi:hypothetical protein